MTEHPFRADESTPPTPPPTPPEVAEGGRLPGEPRCYYCGSRFQREDDVAKTRHPLGNGYAIYVMICRECRGKKQRSEPPFNKPAGCSTAALQFAVVALFAGFLSRH